MTDPNRRARPNGGPPDDGDKPDWLKALGWAGALGLAAWGISKVIGSDDPPIRLFWDIENARCNIPYKQSLAKCVAYLRDVAQKNGVGDDTEYRIKVVCGGHTDKCAATRCFYGPILCSHEVRANWTAGKPMKTTVDGALLHCGWNGMNQRDRADDIILQDLKAAFAATTAPVTLMIITTDVSFRKRAERVVERPNVQKVIYHPNDPQGPVWPSDPLTRLAL